MLTNIGLSNHAKRALQERWGYVKGTFGQYLTEALLQYKLKQYGDDIKKYIDFIRENYLNKKRTADCVGLAKSYIWWDDELDNPVYDSKTDINETQMFNFATEKGTIDTIPEIEGICVWKRGHMGIYIGNGKIIEAKGTLHGVVETPIKGSGSSNFTHWFKCSFVEYIEGDDDMPDIPQWKKDCANYLLKQGYLNIPHDPLEIIDMGTLGAILKNRDEKIKELLKQL